MATFSSSSSSANWDGSTLPLPDIDHMTSEFYELFNSDCPNSVSVEDYLEDGSSSAPAASVVFAHQQITRTSSASSMCSFASAAFTSAARNSSDTSVPSTSSSSSKPHPVPIPSSTSITAANVSALTELLQSKKFTRLNLQAEFEFPSAPSSSSQYGVSRYCCTCRIVDRTTKEVVKELVDPRDHGWPSKKHAKEAAAKRGIDWVNQPENLGARLAAIREKEKSAGVEKADDGINWVGQLGEYVQKKGIPYPEYNYFLVPSQTPLFSCTCDIQASMLHQSLPEKQTLGSAHIGYASKKAAKTSAAKAAMLWLRSQPCLSQGADSRGSPLAANGPKTNKAASCDGNSHSNGNVGDGRHPLTGQSIVVSKYMSNREAVGAIIRNLKYEMKYDLKRDKEAVDMYTVEVIIDRRWGARQLKVQLDKLIRGKEAAKENAADRVMYWFVKQELKRLDIRLEVEDLDN